MNCNVKQNGLSRYIEEQRYPSAPLARKRVWVVSSRAADAALALVGSVACAAAALVFSAGIFSP